jgi:large subunit ribosomal protein LP1
MTQQLACTYAALLLADSGKTDAATIVAVAKAAKVEVSKGMASAFAALLKDVNVDEILKNVSFGGGCAAPAGGAAPAKAGAAAPAKAAAAPEPEEEEDDFGMGGLF